MIRRPPLKPTDPMPWGIHKGTEMGKLPIDYLLFLREQPWILDWPAIYAYLETRKADIEKLAVHPEDDASSNRFSTYEEYLRSTRR